MPITRWEPFQEIERWEPWREIEHLQQRMNRLFERMIPGGDGGGVSALTFIPSAEMEETADEVHLRLEIPGLESKDLNVEVTEESVSISGERKSETKTEEKGVTRSEFRYGKFERIIPLPAHVQKDKAQAEYKTVFLPSPYRKLKERRKKPSRLTLVSLLL